MRISHFLTTLQNVRKAPAHPNCSSRLEKNQCTLLLSWFYIFAPSIVLLKDLLYFQIRRWIENAKNIASSEFFSLFKMRGHLHSYQRATCFESQNKTLEDLNQYIFLKCAICMPDSTKWNLMTNWSGPFKSAKKQ